MAGFFRTLFDQAFPSNDHDHAPSDHPASTLRRAEHMLLPVTAAYRRRLAQCGATPKGVFWSNEANVQQRFQVLCRVFDPADIAAGEAVVRDFGCGYGALYDHLKGHPVIRGGRYVGYDITESMIDACERRIRDPRASFRCSARPATPADYTLVSGTFNLKLDAGDGAWLAYVEACLELLWETTERALAFNMLDQRHDDGLGGLYYADAGHFLDFCRSKLSPHAELIENYGLPDFTVMVRAPGE